MKKRITYYTYFFALMLAVSLTQKSHAGVFIEKVFTVAKTQLPSNLRNFNPALVYILFSGNPICLNKQHSFRGDSITNYSAFIDSAKSCGTIEYRLIFQKGSTIDSVWQLDNAFKVTDKAYPLNNNKLRIIAFDKTGQQTDNFVFDYGKKYLMNNLPVPSLNELMGLFTVYSYSDRTEYVPAAVWILSIGINDYGEQHYLTCESDATAYIAYFKEQYLSLTGALNDAQIHSYLLLNKQANKDSILHTLKEIAAKASANDYFIFNFSGLSNLFTEDSVNYKTYFFPYEVISQAYDTKPKNRNKNDKSSPIDNLISLKTLQEYIQLIPCTKQLFISEAGPSDKFKTEFVKTMMQNSPELASLLNVNRVIIVPNKLGFDNLAGLGKAPITHYITSLDTGYNIYELFGSEFEADKIAYLLKSAEYKTPAIKDGDYFSVFFERKFLQQYREVFGEMKSKRRGLDLGETELKDIAGFSGNRYALIIGTDHYKAKGWEKLDNPVYDATEVAGALKNYYDYNVTLLKDPPMDTVYNAISEYYKTLRENDQLIIYIAGHGDFDAGLLDDGFIVCTDSKSPEIDQLRNSYIQHTKLKKMINKIPAKQILVLLDICHGGVFDDAVLGRQRDNPTSAITNRNVLELLKDKSELTTRRVLSSVGKESAFDGKAGKHSPFAAYLLKILNARGGTEGIVTLSDIYALLQKASLNETETLKISPHMAGFGQNDPMSEFILIPVSSSR